MPINISGVGSSGAHTFRKTNVNLVSNNIYYKGTSGVPADNIPTSLTDGTGFIYSSGVGSLTGITNNGLVFMKRNSLNSLSFSATQGGVDIDLTDLTAGAIKFNTPCFCSSCRRIRSHYW